MSQIILIESSPVSSGGVCQVLAGQPVTFTVISGITAGLNIAYEWYLNDVLVGIGSGYTLASPQESDEVYLNVLNCSVNGAQIGDWIEDIVFYFNDVTAGLPQLYYIDLMASFDYEVISTVLRSDATILDAEIQINGTPIVWPGSSTSIDITPVITETLAVNDNHVLEDDLVTLVTYGVDTDSPTIIQGKLKIRRAPLLSCDAPTLDAISGNTYNSVDLYYDLNSVSPWLLGWYFTPPSGSSIALGGLVGAYDPPVITSATIGSLITGQYTFYLKSFCGEFGNYSESSFSNPLYYTLTAPTTTTTTTAATTTTTTTAATTTTTTTAATTTTTTTAATTTTTTTAATTTTTTTAATTTTTTTAATTTTTTTAATTTTTTTEDTTTTTTTTEATTTTTTTTAATTTTTTTADPYNYYIIKTFGCPGCVVAGGTLNIKSLATYTSGKYYISGLDIIQIQGEGGFGEDGIISATGPYDTCLDACPENTTTTTTIAPVTEEP